MTNASDSDGHNGHHSDLACDGFQPAGVSGSRSCWLVIAGKRVSTSRR